MITYQYSFTAILATIPGFPENKANDLMALLVKRIPKKVKKVSKEELG
jgi:hypothetical protein